MTWPWDIDTEPDTASDEDDDDEIVELVWKHTHAEN